MKVMRKIFTLCVMLLSMATLATAQSAPKRDNFEGVRLTDVSIVHQNGMLKIGVSMEFGGKHIPTNCATIYTPVLYNEGNSIELQSVGIFGRNHYYSTLREKHPRLTNIPADWCLRRSDLPASVDYYAEVDYEPWMNGASLAIFEQLYGCNDELLAIADVVIDEYSEVVIEPVYLFVLPERVESGVSHASRSAHVDFAVNKAVIDPNFHGNSREIAIIDSSLDSLSGDSGVVVTRLVVRGSASPEGGSALNDELAHERAAALIKHIKQHYNIPQGVLATYYDTDHWVDVREWVAQSNVADREALLKFIDENAKHANFNTMLMERFPMQYQQLLAEYYPSLRNASYDVEYDVENFVDVERIVAVALSAPMTLSVDDLNVAATQLDESSPAFDNIIMTIVTKAPNKPAANINAANVAMRRGELQRAEHHLAKAGTSAEADYARAMYAIHMGDYSEAKHLLKRVESKIAHATKLLNKIEEAGY